MRFVLFGFPIHVQTTFWLTALLLARPSGFDRASMVRLVTWTATVFLSILVHELGHALAMRAFGRGASIELVALGGLTRWGDGPRVSGWKSALVSLAGPGAGFLLAAPLVAAYALGFRPTSPLAREAVTSFLWVNVGWGLVNLLPILPLDGGRVMQSTLVSLFGLSGGRFARILSLGLGVAVGVFALKSGAVWIAFLAGFGVLQTYRESPIGDAAVPETTRGNADGTAMVGALGEAWGLLWSGRPDEAEAAAERGLAALPDTAETVGLRVRLLEAIAWARLDGGDEARSRAVLARIPSGAKASDLLTARLELARTGGEPAQRRLEEAFWEAPSDHGAMVVAMTYLEAGHPDRVVALMRRADGRVGALAHTRIDAALFYAGHFSSSFDVAELGWERFHQPIFAYNAACALARMGRVDDGLGWIGRAIEGGWEDRDALDRDEDLGPLRADPRFAELRGRIRSQG